MKFYKSLSPLAKILFSTMVFFAYNLLVVLPFSMAYAPANESTTEWWFPLAPLIYLLLFLPIFILYLVVVVNNIWKVKGKRSIAYPVCFITIFVAVHVFLITAAAVLSFSLVITVPIWFILFCIMEIEAIVLDAKDKKQLDKKEIKKTINNRNDKIVYIIFGCLVGLLVVVIIVYEILLSLASRPEFFDIGKERIFSCENDKNMIKTAMNNVDIDLSKASFEDISKLFEKELSKKDIYEPLFGKKYKIFSSSRDSYSNFEFQYNEGFTSISTYFYFERNWECSKESKNCYWSIPTCRTGGIFIDENWEIID